MAWHGVASWTKQVLDPGSEATQQDEAGQGEATTADEDQQRRRGTPGLSEGLVFTFIRDAKPNVMNPSDFQQLGTTRTKVFAQSVAIKPNPQV